MKTLFYAVVALLCLTFTAPVKGNSLSQLVQSEVTADLGGGIVTIVQGRTSVVISYESEVTFPVRKSLSIEGWKTGAYIVIVKRGGEVYASRFEVL